MSAMAVADLRSDAARRANETRRSRADAALFDADVALLRGVYTDEKRDLFSRVVLPYLIAAAGGEPAGDLLGGGHSAAAMVAAGLRVISCDDLRLATGRREGGLGLTRDRALRAAQRIADEAGAQFHVGKAEDVLDRVSVFYFDGMGPLGPTTPTGRFLAEATRHPVVRHVVVTYMASRMNGASEVSDGARLVYDLAADATARRLGMHGVHLFPYKSGRIPMGVLVACIHNGRGRLCSAERKARRQSKLEQERARDRHRYWFGGKREWMEQYRLSNRERIRERDRERRSTPEYREYQRNYNNARYANDPDFRERKKSASRRRRCTVCDEFITYHAERFAWVHVKPGADHAPIPAK